MHYIYVYIYIYVICTYHTCIYNRLPEDELSGSKHVEDIKQLKIKILVHMTAMFCIGRDSSVGRATRYEMYSPGIESRWGARFVTACGTCGREEKLVQTFLK
jgi:hypothetical protein